MTQSNSNFDFLISADPELANLGKLAESYFHDDPSTSLFKLRQFGERLAQRHAALVGVNLDGADSQNDILRRLKVERAAPERVLDMLHHIGVVAEVPREQDSHGESLGLMV